MTKREMRKLRKGDLVYLPSKVTLYKFEKSNRWGQIPFVSRAVQTSKPLTTAFVGLNQDYRGEGYCKVLYNGEIWNVESNKIFLGGKNDQTNRSL